jgi:signal peptidase I
VLWPYRPRSGYPSAPAWLTLLLLALAVAAALAAAGCGGSGQKPAGSIPVKTVGEARTGTYSVTFSSMEPTIHCARPAPGCVAAKSDYVVVERPVGTLRRGDVVLFEAPPAMATACNASGKYIKRVIGLPGEKVEERKGYIFIDGKTLSEPYVTADRRDHQAGAWNVTRGRYFLMGDNRVMSCDSRRWGALPAANLIGKVVQIERVG